MLVGLEIPGLLSQWMCWISDAAMLDIRGSTPSWTTCEHRFRARPFQMEYRLEERLNSVFRDSVDSVRSIVLIISFYAFVMNFFLTRSWTYREEQKPWAQLDWSYASRSSRLQYIFVRIAPHQPWDISVKIPTKSYTPEERPKTQDENINRNLTLC